MNGLNTVILGGFLTRDPQLRYTVKQVPVASFGLKVIEVRGSGGERKEVAVAIDCVCFNSQAESVAKSLKAGSQVIVVGKLTMRQQDSPGGRGFRFFYDIEAREVHFVPRGTGLGASPSDEDGDN